MQISLSDADIVPNYPIISFHFTQNIIKQIQSWIHAHTLTELIKYKFQGHTKRERSQIWERGRWRTEKGLMRR